MKLFNIVLLLLLFGFCSIFQKSRNTKNLIIKDKQGAQQMTKITNVLTIKEPDMFLRKVDLIQEYVFQRIKNALDSIKLNQEKLSNISEQDEVKNLLQSEFHKAMISMSKQDISCLYSVARDFNGIIELEYWKQQVLQDASKVLFKD